jgi:hypothetical protein
MREEVLEMLQYARENSQSAPPLAAFEFKSLQVTVALPTYTMALRTRYPPNP